MAAGAGYLSQATQEGRTFDAVPLLRCAACPVTFLCALPGQHPARIWPDSGKILARTWPDVGSIWPEPGKVLARSGQNRTRLRSHGRDPAQVWPGSGPDLARIWPDPGRVLARTLTDSAREFRSPLAETARKARRDRAGRTESSREIAQAAIVQKAQLESPQASHRNLAEIAHAPHIKLT